MMDTAPLLRDALAAHRAGRLAEAETLYRRALQGDETVEALSNLAVLQAGQGAFDEAEALYRRALAHAPEDAGLHVNRHAKLTHFGGL